MWDRLSSLSNDLRGLQKTDWKVGSTNWEVGPTDWKVGSTNELYGRRDVWLGVALVILAFGLLVEAKLWRPDTRFTIKENVQIGEAEAWWKGRLDLPERKWDTALKDGRVYSHFPPMFSVIAAVVVPLFRGVPHWFIVLALVLPVLLLAYALFFRRTGSPVWAALLAIGLACGTSALPVIDKTLRGASPYFVNQTLATVGLLIMLVESFGRRRVWMVGIGLVVAALSRQMTVAYLIPVIWLDPDFYTCFVDKVRIDIAARMIAELIEDDNIQE